MADNGTSINKISVPVLLVVAGLFAVGGAVVSYMDKQTDMRLVIDAANSRSVQNEREIRDCNVKIQANEVQKAQFAEKLNYIAKKVDEISEDVKEHMNGEQERKDFKYYQQQRKTEK